MHDVHVRSALVRRLSAHFAYDSSTVVVHELGIVQGRVRVDLAAINGRLHGYEIKSASDTLERFERQVEAYSRVLDFAVVVAAEKHAERAARACPDWWGVWVAAGKSDELELEVARAETENPAPEARAIAELLWHDETLALLDLRNASTGIRSKPRRHAWDRLCDVYSLEEIRDAVRASIKGRRVARADQPLS